MAGKLLDKNIAEIKTGDLRWRAKVLVVEKGNVHLTKGKKRLQKLILQDAQGSVVEGVMWNEMIESFATSFTRFCTYSVRGAKVEDMNPKYQNSRGMTMQWIMGSGTVAVPISEESERIPYPPFYATPLSDVERIIKPVDIIAAVINIEERRQVKGGTTWLQELTLIDQSLTPTILTLWGEFLDNQAAEMHNIRHTMPIIVCRNVSDYAVGILTTNVSSYVTVEPMIPEVQALRTWIDENTEAIKASRNRRNTPQRTLIVEGSSGESATNTGETSSEAKSFDFIGKLCIPDVEQPLPYCICSGCAERLGADMGEEVPCPTCSAIKKAVPTYKVAIRLDRDGGNIEATMFDRVAEQLLEISPEKAHATTTEELKDLLKKINEKFQMKTIQAEIRPSVRWYENQQSRYEVHKWNEMEDGSTSSTQLNVIVTLTLQPTGTQAASAIITHEISAAIDLSHTPDKTEGKRNRCGKNGAETEAGTMGKKKKTVNTERSTLQLIDHNLDGTPSASLTQQNNNQPTPVDPVVLCRVKLEYDQKP